MDKELEGRKQEAEYLEPQLEELLDAVEDRLDELRQEADADIEKVDQAEKALAAVQKAQALMETEEDAPSDDAIAQVYDLWKTAKMHANEADVALPTN